MKNPIIPLYKQADRLIIRSENSYVYDSDNKQYIDFESGDWSSNLGHSNPKINERIKQQVDKLIHDGLRFRNNESEQLSLKLLDKLGLTGGAFSIIPTFQKIKIRNLRVFQEICQITEFGIYG